MTLQLCNNNDILLFPLQIWKQPHQIKSSDQFTVNTQDTDCFEHLHEENAKSQTHVFYGFYWRRDRRSDGILIEWDRDVDVLETVFPPPNYGREECC